MKKKREVRPFSRYIQGKGWQGTFWPKYQQGDTVYVRLKDAFGRPIGPKMRGTITGANLDSDMSFVSWQVLVPSIGNYLQKFDPQCPWNKKH